MKKKAASALSTMSVGTNDPPETMEDSLPVSERGPAGLFRKLRTERA
jgi:hypothetical protein